MFKILSPIFLNNVEILLYFVKYDKFPLYYGVHKFSCMGKYYEFNTYINFKNIEKKYSKIL